MQDDVEIERKYLLSAMPEFDSIPGESKAERHEVEQGWNPGDNIRERLRRTVRGSGTAYYRTLKFGSGLVRTEIEESIDQELFESMWPLTRSRRIRKIRWLIRDGDRVWELDEFVDRDLVLLEIELASADETVALPGWAAAVVDREVTDESGFTNYALAGQSG